LFYIMHKLNIPCRYVPVHWKNKPGSQINILACAIRDPIDMVKIRMRDFAGQYNRPLLQHKQPWQAVSAR
jgi:hypothetical protein